MDHRRYGRPLWVCSTVLLAVTALFAACATTNGRNAAELLQASPEPLERDIPLPAGFVLVERSSEDWSSGATRYVRHRYRGRRSVVEVRGFYRRQMPLIRWTPVVDRLLDGRRTLQFERGQEACMVTITARSGLFSGGSIVDVIIGPLQR